MIPGGKWWENLNGELLPVWVSNTDFWFRWTNGLFQFKADASVTQWLFIIVIYFDLAFILLCFIPRSSALGGVLSFALMQAIYWFLVVHSVHISPQVSPKGNMFHPAFVRVLWEWVYLRWQWLRNSALELPFQRSLGKICCMQQAKSKLSQWGGGRAFSYKKTLICGKLISNWAVG